MNGVTVVFGTALLSAPAATSEPLWRPGHVTTSQLPGEANVDEERGPAGGDYGRFAGDLDVSVSAGVELASEPTRGLLELAAHYYSMAGPYLSLRPPLLEGKGGDDPWTGSLGVDLTPVFIPRWAMDMEHGPALFDLMLDSLAISAGAFAGLGRSQTNSRPAGFEAGLGAGIPLLATASGPWLKARYVLSWGHTGSATASVWLCLSWHLLLDTPLSAQTGAVDY